MGVWNNVRTDLRLRNLTIYAQSNRCAILHEWLTHIRASVLAAMLLYLSAIPVLFVHFNFLFSLSSSAKHVDLRLVLLNTLYVGAMSFLFPLAPLVLDLPQYIRRKPFLYASMVSWFAIPVRLIILLFSLLSKQPTKYVIQNFIAIFIFAVTLMVFQVTIMSPIQLGTRLAINILYCGQLVFSTYVDRVLRNGAAGYGWLIWFRFWVHCIAAGMFGVAALLCSISWTMRHTWVSSRSLGGTGIEPMLLMLPGRGPLYQSVGDEAREGAIRLV